ncbi:MAG: 1-(5-phosphoribosyl)-5-[(5-phosphoribosylamino)methylideneamino]imidazole-4-carboxamide isomerase [Chloroflexi bacterium]|nr:1-(5-phosphoribosyl)-5-[(5-phosphoribosylamino)methylideneamino]imidazole-4-carboxamide isomerase [Chloroflexota bacterium]
MDVIPAIDLRGGKAVRLYQGDYARETVFDGDPVAVAVRWVAEGACRIHVVDLDGAREGRPVQAETVGRIVSAAGVPVQLGGGLRTLADLRVLLDLGVDRVILGTVAAEAPDLVEEACQVFGPEAIIVGIDARDGLVALRGWREGSTLDAIELARSLVLRGVRRFVHTDIARDGTLAGPNLAGMRAFIKAVDAAVIASGGVSNAADVSALADTGVEGVIIGRALYTGAVSIAAALAASAPR